jgi:hypothetical protein
MCELSSWLSRLGRSWGIQVGLFVKQIKYQSEMKEFCQSRLFVKDGLIENGIFILPEVFNFEMIRG